MILIQAIRLHAAKGERLSPFVAVSMLGGIRTEEARALRWSEVDLGRVQTPAPPGFADRCHCAGPAVRQQRNGRRRPNLTR
jgi:integrase